MQRDPRLELTERFLDHLIDPNDCIDTFGRSYVDDLELIVAENHGYDFATRSFRPYADLAFSDERTDEWFKRVQEVLGVASMEAFIAYARAHLHELRLANVRPRLRSEEIYQSRSSFHELKATAWADGRSNELQRQWSADQHQGAPQLESDPDYYESYLRYDRISPWTYLVRREMHRGNLAADDKVVCIGNRWSGEVRYFRENIGLRNTMGVDLFSADPDYVIAADMHAMPFEDHSVKLVFARGVANKSYDFRRFLKELRRILRKDGFLIIEQPAYTHGVDVLGATELKRSANLLRLLRGQLQRIIYTDAVVGHGRTFHDVGIVKIFVQLGPQGGAELPAVEPFPYLRFYLHDLWRSWILLWRQGTSTRHPNAQPPAVILSQALQGALSAALLLPGRVLQVLLREGPGALVKRVAQRLRRR